MNEKNKLIGKMEQAPIIEITAGKVIKRPTEITFHSKGALDIKYFWKICSLLENHRYDSNKLELTSKKLGSQVLAHRKNGEYIIDGEVQELDYFLKYDNLDDETKNGIKEFLKSIPYVKGIS